MDTFLFLIFAAIALVCAVNVVVQTHPISSALSLVGTMTALAVLYLLLGAEFIAMAQMIVYAGAIMVLFVFVIMLLNAGAEQEGTRSSMAKLFGVPAFAALLAIVGFAVLRFVPAGAAVEFGKFTGGSPRDVGAVLFTEYLLPFEVTSVLILVAIAGAIVLAYKEID